MDILQDAHSTMQTIEMHTSGEPTRIIVRGYPVLQGSTLLEKRRYAREHHDDIRRQLMLEPRGHSGMYGAILVPETELTRNGDADIGVLFCHNEGYSTMCGHATIALGRFLVDTRDEVLFPKRNELRTVNGQTLVRLHVPCGIVHISVPTTAEGRSRGDLPIQFVGGPSFVSKRHFVASIPPNQRWSSKAEVRLDVAYGGAFYAIVSAEELGFPEGIPVDGSGLGRMASAAAILKEIVGAQQDVLKHPHERDLEFLYGVMIVDTAQGGDNGELGLCFFADGQVDRSPTGSCVMARVALAIEQGKLRQGEWWTYESIVSLGKAGNAFRGCAVEVTDEGVMVRVEGKAYYTGSSVFMREELDSLGDGFSLQI
ncbi:proline racemase [Mucidula mucida]|nr:proline racemase [Mucidula mucida]